MLLNLTAYHRPATVAEAVRLLADGRCKAAVLAGGTELVGSDAEVDAVIDLRELGLSGIDADDDKVTIGAMATLKQIASSPLVQALASGILAKAAQHSAPATIRAAATLGGTLAGRKGGEEIPTALLALEARVRIAMPGPHEVDFERFLAQRDLLLREGIITAVVIPAGAATGGLARVSRTTADQAIMCAAAVMQGKAVTIAVGGLAAQPVRWPARVERPVSDHRGSAQYRRWVAPVLVQRAVTEAMGGADA